MNNLRGVDLNLLVVLDALLAERHVTRAALRLNMSQPAVSHALGRLRILLDDPLFLRQGGTLEPTIRALDLRTPLAEALGRIRAVLTPEGFEPARSPHRFRLAMSDYGASLILPKLVRHLRAIAPRIDLVVTQHSREGMIAAILDGEDDLGFGVFPALPDRVLGEEIHLDRYACLLDRRGLRGGVLDLARYLAAPHALVAVHGQASTEIDQALHALNLSRHVAVILPHWMLAPQLIAGTDLILTVAQSSLTEIARDGDLAVLPPPFALPPISFRQISQSRRRTDPALRWLRAEIAACLADGG